MCFCLSWSVAVCLQAHSSSCSHQPSSYFSKLVAMVRESPTPTFCDLISAQLLHHSSLAGLSSRGVKVGRPSPVALWDAVRLATVCRRTRTSRQSLSRLLHSLQAAEELREVRCWHGGWVLFRVPLERLSTFESHRTSQHSAFGSTPDGYTSSNPGCF